MSVQDDAKARFRREALEHGLRYRCPHCDHWNRASRGCSLGYPNEMMLEEDLRSRDREGRLLFCKYFELDGA